MQPLKLSELDFASKASICWSFLWRGILATIGSMVLGFVLGAAFGFDVALVAGGGRAVMPLIQIGGFFLGAACGVVCLYFYIRWLLGTRLGRFRLLLVSTEG